MSQRNNSGAARRRREASAVPEPRRVRPVPKRKLENKKMTRGHGASRPAKRGVRAKPVKARIGSMDYTFLMLVLVLVTVGLIMMFSASYPAALNATGDSFYFIKRQLLFAIVGVAAMFVASRVPFQILHRFALLLYGLSIVLLIVVLLLPEQSGVHRWITIPGVINIQPSEIAKFSIVVLFAHLISINYEKMKDPRYGIWPFLALLGVICVLMVLEPHLSGTILILGIGIIMMFVGGADVKWFFMGGLAAAVLVAIVALMPGIIPYAQTRLNFWLDPWSAPRNEGYQTCQSLLAIGSGGLFGVGIGNSRQKHLYLPEPQNDFVFSIVCEELGLVGAVLIILVFVLLIWRGYVIAMRCRDRFGSMLAVGLITQVAIQTILNIAVVTNTIPNTGISLPFFSYGGTSLVMLLGQMGFVLSVSRQTTLEKLE
ncbi:MAG: putative lipid II flippase FtsW [Oscillospiraceae bacterium]|nr:putative lipid II flippase FtsW [Oscillospiraceae bacterium]MCI9363245.1 putative lipid II flippase FtsW [Oscillospiraceae bacterium]RKJ57054.1 putative lipid II flippase FtsW [bacterium 1XD42-8]RKJ65068.1 putative lipid II flippase FtsW [bacterium 1XD42-1]